MNWRCLFGHDRMPMPHLPGFGMAPAWACRRCPEVFLGFRYPRAPAMPPVKPPRVDVAPMNEDR